MGIGSSDPGASHEGCLTNDARPCSPHLYTLLNWRLTGLGLNPSRLANCAPEQSLSLKQRCALCRAKTTCLEAMMDSYSPSGWETYCPNAAAIHTLLAISGFCRIGGAALGYRVESSRIAHNDSGAIASENLPFSPAAENSAR